MAESEDQHLKCVDCGEEFLFTAGEQAFYRDHGLSHPPNRCKRCREARKQQRAATAPAGDAPPAGGREMHAAVCSECGAETMVPFVPTSNRPIYCRDCYRAHRPQRPSARGQPAASAPPAASAGGRFQGAVKWFNETRGFGFIQDDTGEEIFVHFSAIVGGGFRTLTQGDRVEFDVIPGTRGKQAANVSRIE